MRVVYIATSFEMARVAEAYRSALRAAGVDDAWIVMPAPTGITRAPSEILERADIVHVFGQWREEYGSGDRYPLFLHAPIERAMVSGAELDRALERTSATVTSSDPAIGAYREDVLWVPYPLRLHSAAHGAQRRWRVMTESMSILAQAKVRGVEATDIRAIPHGVISTWLLSCKVLIDRLTGGPSWRAVEAAAHGAAVLWGATDREADAVVEAYGQELPGLASYDDAQAALDGDPEAFAQLHEAQLAVMQPTHDIEAVGHMLAKTYEDAVSGGSADA